MPNSGLKALWVDALIWFCNPQEAGSGSIRAAAARSSVTGTSGNLTTWLILVYESIYSDTLRTSWVIRCYRITQYENQGNRISRDIRRLSISRHIRLAKSISSYIRRYTFGQSYMSRYTIIRVTQYLSVYLSMNFSDKVYTRINPFPKPIGNDALSVKWNVHIWNRLWKCSSRLHTGTL